MSNIEIIIEHHLQIAKKTIKSQLHDIIHGERIIIFHRIQEHTDDWEVLCLSDLIKINEI